MNNVYRDIAKGSAIIMVSRIILKLFSIGSYFLILRELSFKDYGFVTLALSISGPTLALSGFGLDDLLLARGARARGEGHYKNFSSILGGFVMVRIIMLGLITYLLLVVNNLLGEQYQAVISKYFWPAVIWIWIVNLRWICDGLTQMFENFKRFSVANVMESAMRAGFILILFFWGQLNISTVLWAYVVSKGLPMLFLFPVLQKLGGNWSLWAKFKAFYQFIKENGAWETVRMLSGSLLSGVGQWIIAGLLGLEAVAVFSFATSLNSLLAQFSPFRQLLYPIISRLSFQSDKISEVARRMSKYTFWLAGLLIISAALGAPLGVWLLAPKYLSSLPAFYLLMLSQLTSAITVSHGPLMYSLNEQKYLLKLSLLGTLSSITVLPIFIWTMGVFGAILENHFSTLLIAWLRERKLRNKYKIKTFVLKDLFVFGSEDKLAVKKIWRAGFARLKAYI